MFLSISNISFIEVKENNEIIKLYLFYKIFYFILVLLTIFKIK
jgi:hypothetical protein